MSKQFIKTLLFLHVIIVPFIVYGQDGNHYSTLEDINENSGKAVKFLDISDDTYDSALLNRINIPDTIYSLSLHAQELNELPINDESPVINSITMYDDIGICKPVYMNFDKIKGLKYLSIVSNVMNGFPENLLNCKELTYLNIGGNNLSNIPDAFFKLSHLEVLSITADSLGIGPKSIFTLKNITELNLDMKSINSQSQLDFRNHPET